MSTEMHVQMSSIAAFLGGLLAVITAAMGGWSSAMTVLIVLLVVDFVLGTVRSAIQGRLSSLTSVRKTGLKVVLLWALVTFANQLDCSLSTGAALRDGVVVFFTVAQATSVLENAVPIAESVGWTVPPLLKRALEQLGNGGGKAE